MKTASFKHAVCICTIVVSIGIALVAASAGRAKADEKLDQLLSTALENHPDIVAAKAKVALAEAELNAARLQVARQMIALWSEKKSQEAAMYGLQAQINNTNDPMKRTEISRNLDDARSKMEMTNTMLNFLTAKPAAPATVAPYGMGITIKAEQPTQWAKEIQHPAKSVIDKVAKECFTQTIDVNFDETPLEKMFSFLSDSTNFPFFLDKKALSEAGFSEETPITMKIRKAPLPAILQAFEDQNQELVFVIRDYGILLTTVEQAKAQGYYPARTLTGETKSGETLKTVGGQTTQNMYTLKNALNMYEIDTGEFPKANQWPNAMLANPGVKGWAGPYLNQNILTDEWGTSIRYEARQGSYELRSAGPDKQFGTSDDITQSLRFAAPR